MRPHLRQQRTLARSVCVSGFGYWSGKDVTVEFRPAAPDTGIVFVRADQPAAPRIAAVVAHRVEVPRRTTLATGSTRVEMVEHVMAALAGLQIDNCEIHVDQAELPGCDGSSKPFVEALCNAGIESQQPVRPQLLIRRVTRVGDDDCWVEARPGVHPGLVLQYDLDYGADNPIGRQSIQVRVTPESFRRELAAARTFLLREEAEWLRARGMGRRVTNSDLLVFDEQGPVGNTLRYSDECVRHKALDLLGDLALAGCDVSGEIVAHRSGHRLNAELVAALVAAVRAEHGWRKSA